MSGGGATGVAHLGVLKALEENNIPIDYITGTSAGALIGSMYACGYSLDEIETIILSDDFQKMVSGELKPSQRFIFREDDVNSSMVHFSLSQENLLDKSLPTNLSESTFLDLEMLKILGTTSAVYGDNFDSLFVPFRCLASNIVTKKSVKLSNGPLNEAVRASMTYPFLFKPIKINDTVMFDGGLYDNFPVGVMTNTFSPDFIIGSNVSSNNTAPDQDDLIGQVSNMLTNQSDYSIPAEKGVLIEPKTEVGTFDFEDVRIAIQDGYNATMAQMDEIKSRIKTRKPTSELKQQRALFRSKIPEFIISGIHASSDKKKLLYSSRSILRGSKPKPLGLKEFEKRYYRLNAVSQIQFMYPTVSLKKDTTYNLDLNIRKAKEIEIEAGGIFSSRPINTGYVSLSYQSIGRILTKTKAESYFGKFYGAFSTKFTVEIPSIFPFSTSAFFTLNRWDYFRSFATFFEDAQPSFLIQEEMYAGISLDHPMGNSIKSTWESKWFSTSDRYYQTETFTNKDTTDQTNINGGTFSWTFNQTTLNRKQFATGGKKLLFSAKFIYGREHSRSGSTAPTPFDIIKNHSWVNLKLEYQNYLIDYQNFHLGIHVNAVANTQPKLANYTATLLSQNAYSPIVDSRTYFLPEYRSQYFAGLGLNAIFTVFKKFDLRIDAYYYQPIISTILENGVQVDSEPFKNPSYMASASLIYHSFLGPIRLTLNHFPEEVEDIKFQFSVGYVLFKDRAIR